MNRKEDFYRHDYQTGDADKTEHKGFSKGQRIADYIAVYSRY